MKHFHAKSVLFTAEDLVNEGIDLIQNTSPQQYFPVCIKADIIQDLKKRKNVLVEPTGVNLSNSSLISNNKNLEYQKAQSFLDVLLYLPFAPLYIHKLQLRLHIDKQYYKELTHKEGRINRAKIHEEIIGRRHVTYTFSPNGTVEIAVKSSDTPFRLETDEDESTLFSFLGQVKDRLLYRVGDIKERSVPATTEWVLKACDVNKDVIIDGKAQLTLSDIQLKYADRVFRQYVKCLHDKAVYRPEESLTLNHHLLLKEALDNIRYPHKPIVEDGSSDSLLIGGEMYKLHSSSSTGNKKEAKIEETCLRLVLVRVYTKDLKDKGTRIRLERQEYPNKTFVEAIEEKLNAHC